MRLLFFGKLADAAGGRTRDMALAPDMKTPADIVAAIAREDEALAAALSAPSIKIAVNEKIAGREAAISDNDEIAFLPPVSGG